MVYRGSLFNQIISTFNRQEYYRSEIQHKSEHYHKGFSSWHHFVGMLFS